MADRSGGPYFGPELFRFLKELAKNNDRAWFQANKDRYLAAVQEPAVRFIAEMGPPPARLSRSVTADARPFGGSLSRIYRDTRFSKDKSPYRTSVGVRFAHADAKGTDDHLPGFFVHLAPHESSVYAGIWRPAPPMARTIREAIASPGSGWAKVRESGIALEGERYARLPAGFDREYRFASDLQQNDFYTGRSLDDRAVGGPSFGTTVLANCRELDPLNRFLAKAIGVDW